MDDDQQHHPRGKRMLPDLTAMAEKPHFSRVWDIAARCVAGGGMGLLAASAYSSALHVMRAPGFSFAALLPVMQLAAGACLFVLLVIQTTLILARPLPLAKAHGLHPRVSALLGTWLIALVLLIPIPQNSPLSFNLAAAAAGALGDAIAIFVMFYLGPSFSIMAEARRFVATGPYALVRHPLYLAEELGLISAVLTRWSIAAAIVLGIQMFCQWQRARNEEAVLARVFVDYADYRRRVPMLVPRWPRHWR